VPSVSKKQAHLFAAVAHNPQFAKKVGIPQSVGQEFNKADQRTGILKRGAGGNTPNEAGMNSKMNFGQGHGHSMFSTMPLMGHALSGSQLGQADHAIRAAHQRLSSFAEGGEVKKPPGPSAKERAEIRGMIERGKDDALAALRNTRAALALSVPGPAANDDDYGSQLEGLRSRLAMKDGGEVSDDNPQEMYREYVDLTKQLNEESHPELQAQLVSRLAQLEQKLEGLGVNLPTGDAA
jgi:hypothetical protein